MKSSVCAVFGGSGFLGQEAVPVLRKSFEVVATGRRVHGNSVRALDLRDGAALRRFLDEVQPSQVVALAAYRDPDLCEEQPEEAFRLNTEPLATLCHALAPETPLLLVSTDYVFDGRHPPYREDSLRQPLSVYGQTKVKAEDIVLARPGGMVLRVPLLMGWADRRENSGFLSQLYDDVTSRPPKALDHVLHRYPVWTREVGEAMRILLSRGEPGLFHFSTMRALTRYTAALEFAELLGVSSDHLTPSDQIIPRRAERPRDAALSIEKWMAKGYPAPSDFRVVAKLFIEHFGLRQPKQKK
jgi:dTDP-4-dehydrorhamnose reductase